MDINRGRLDMSADIVQPDASVCGAETDAVEEVLRLTDGRGADGLELPLRRRDGAVRWVSAATSRTRRPLPL